MSNSTQSGSTGGGDRPAQSEYSRRCRDRRLHGKMWIPRYVWRYAPELGPNGIALYVALAFHCTSEAPERWPSIRQLGELLGLSRSTVERTLRLLRGVKMLHTEPCLSPQGQRSNYFDLIDPPGEGEQAGSHGTDVAGAVTSEGGAPSPVTGPPVTSEGGAPSPVTAPSLFNGSKEACVKDSGAHAPCAAPAPEIQLTEIEALAAHWIAQLPPGGARWKDLQTAEVRWWLGVLLADGWTADQLSASIDQPDRKRGEWPREWAGRLGRRPLKVARTPPTAAEVAHKRNAEAEQRARERSSPEYQRVMNKLARKIGKLPPGELPDVDQDCGQPPIMDRPG